MSSIKNAKIIIAIVVAIVAAGAFFGGMKYQESRGRTFAQGNFGGDHAGQQGDQGRQRNQGFRPVNGEIISQDDTSVTVKLQDGSSKIVLFSDNTTLNKATTASKSDLKNGERIAVFGTENSDGSLTAQTIQLNPVFRGGPGGEDHAPSGTPGQ